MRKQTRAMTTTPRLRRVAATAALALLAGLPTTLGAPPAQASPTVDVERVSVGTGGVQANDHNQNGSLSADGRYVGNQGYATNWDPRWNGAFVHDRLTGRSSLESYSWDTVRSGWGGAGTPMVTADGRYVAFSGPVRRVDQVCGKPVPNSGESTPGNETADVFWRDMIKGGPAKCASQSSNGTPGNSLSAYPAITPDGRYIAYESRATNLVTGDTNNAMDIFVHDTLTRETTRESIATGGGQGSGFSFTPVISDDGRYVAFYSLAGNLVPGDTNAKQDVFVRDRLLGTLERVSVSSTGAQGDDASGKVYQSYHNTEPILSGDGRYVTFESASTNLVAGDTNGLRDIFVRDLQTGNTVRVTKGTGGAQTDGDSVEPSMSGDGRRIFFESWATNLVPSDTNGLRDVYMYDVPTATTTRISLTQSGGEPNAESLDVYPSADGYHAVFTSMASNIVTGDTNGRMDLFVRDLPKPIKIDFKISPPSGVAPLPVEFDASGTTGNGAIVSYQWDFGDGTNGAGPVVNHVYAAKGTYMPSLTVVDTAGNTETYHAQQTPLPKRFAGHNALRMVTVTDPTVVCSDVVERTSVDSAAVEGNDASDTLTGQSAANQASADGNFVVYTSAADNLDGSDTNQASDVFLRNRATGTTTRVSRGMQDANGNPTESNARSSLPAISADGTSVAFLSDATNLVAGDTNGATDVFVWNAATGTVDRVNLGSQGQEADASSVDAPALSDDGSLVAFSSYATNLVPGDSNGNTADVFVRDLAHGTTEVVSLNQAGTQEPYPSRAPDVNGDGTLVAFVTLSHLTVQDNNEAVDVFVHDRTLHKVALASVNEYGLPGRTSVLGGPSISDAGHVAFVTAGDLVKIDVNRIADVYATRRHPSGDTYGNAELVSINRGGNAADGASLTSPAFSADGKQVAFVSEADDLVKNDANGVADVFVRDRAAKATALRSVNANGNQANAPSAGPSTTGDGRTVVYQSGATNLVAHDANNATDVFVHGGQDCYPGYRVYGSGTFLGGQGQQISVSFDIAQIWNIPQVYAGVITLRDPNYRGGATLNTPVLLAGVTPVGTQTVSGHTWWWTPQASPVTQQATYNLDWQIYDGGPGTDTVSMTLSDGLVYSQAGTLTSGDLLVRN